ncbi:MAG: adenylosuccinate synthase, partial [Bacteroidota bacterium]
MKLDVLLGLQWGDEGKGKIVDVLAPDYNVIARFQGGPNAGHSLEFNEIKHVLHTIPSGVFNPDAINIIGNGVVIDPVIFKEEIEELKHLDIAIQKNLFISKRAHLILPSHRILDAASEVAKGKTKIGSTLKGIGPTYMDKTGRNGLRVGDIINPGFKDKYEFLKNKHRSILTQYDFEYDLTAYEEKWIQGIELIKQFKLVESEHLINQYLQEDKTILAEGAQGTLLDIDFGSYPFVTSSNTICAGACTGLGVAPNKIGKVIGIFKAYCTRVGSGPFPTELENTEGEKLRKQGHEFGATTGRPRRCGWLDLPALKYAIMLNGVTELVVTKADVLSGFETIKVCTHYKLNGKKVDF